MKTISKEGYFKYIEKKSSFYAYAIPINNESDIKFILKRIKKKHKAKHYPYAYILNENGEERIRTNNDGEPSGAMALLNLIKKHELTNTIIIVARVFGGIKLGTGGLARAFKEAGSQALEKAIK